MNKKGFTLVELITTFALAAALIVVLVNVVLIIKDIYIKYEIKTELLIKQGELYDVVYKVLDEVDLPEYLAYMTGNTLRYTGPLVSITVNNDLIQVGSFSYKAPPNTTFTTEFEQIPGTNYSKFCIHITHSLFPKQDFGINLILESV